MQSLKKQEETNPWQFAFYRMRFFISANFEHRWSRRKKTLNERLWKHPQIRIQGSVCVQIRQAAETRDSANVWEVATFYEIESSQWTEKHAVSRSAESSSSFFYRWLDDISITTSVQSELEWSWSDNHLENLFVTVWYNHWGSNKPSWYTSDYERRRRCCTKHVLKGKRERGVRWIVESTWRDREFLLGHIIWSNLLARCGDSGTSSLFI